MQNVSQFEYLEYFCRNKTAPVAYISGKKSTYNSRGATTTDKGAGNYKRLGMISYKLIECTLYTLGSLSTRVKRKWNQNKTHSNEQDRQALLKAKYCPRVAAVASAGSNKVVPSSEWLSWNPGQLVQAVSCTQKTHKKPCDLDLWPVTYRLLEVRAKFHQVKFSSCWVIVLTETKLSDEAENNTAVASADSQYYRYF